MSKTLVEAAQEYLEFLRNKGKSPRTLYTYGKDIEQILAFFGPDKEISKVTLSLVGKFYRSDELLKLPNGKERAPRTFLKTARVFRMLMIWAQSQGYIETLPLPKNLPEFEHTPSEISVDSQVS